MTKCIVDMIVPNCYGLNEHIHVCNIQAYLVAIFIHYYVKENNDGDYEKKRKIDI